MAEQFQIIHRKKGMKNLIKKMIWLQAYITTSGIQRNEGKQWIKAGSGSKRIKLATLAHVLEQFKTWIQPKKAVIPTHDGDVVVIEEGARMKRPARPFIMLYKIPNLWSQLREYFRNLVRQHFARKSQNYQHGAKQIMEELGKECQRLQKDRINSIATEGNSEITQKVKGFDWPLMDSGRMEQSIRYKIKTSYDKAHKSEAKLRYLTQIDKYIKQLNGK